MYHHKKKKARSIEINKQLWQNRKQCLNGKRLTYPESDKGGILLSWSKLSKHANLFELIVLELLDGLAAALHK